MSYQRGYQVPAIEITNERNRSAPTAQEIYSEGIGKRTFGQYEHQQAY
jgi:hypothetical protein